MPSPLPRVLIATLLPSLCLGQSGTAGPDKAANTAETLAAALDLRQFHGYLAVEFARVGPTALPVLERFLRGGTDEEALGALMGLVATGAEADRVLPLLTFVLHRRPDVLKIDLLGGRDPRRGGATSPGSRTLFGYLGRLARTDPRAVDLLWSEVDGGFRAIAIAALNEATTRRSRLLQHLAHDLRSQNAADRARAKSWLTWSTLRRREAPADVVAAVAKLLEVLGAGKGDPDLAELERLTRHHDRWTKTAAKEVLERFRDAERSRGTKPAPLPPLPERPRGEPGRIVPKQRDPGPLPPRLVRLLEFAAIREAVIPALGRLGVEAIPELLKALDHRDAGVSAAVAKALAKIDDPRVTGMLKDIAGDARWANEVRILCVEYLGRHLDETEGLFGFVSGLTGSTSPHELRVAAIRELSQTAKYRHDALNRLEHLLRDENPEVVRYTTSALGQMDPGRDDRVVMLLLRQLRHDDNQVKQAAIYALAGKGARLHLERLAARTDLDPDLRRMLEGVLRTKDRVLVGFLIADYSDNRILQVDLRGRTVNSLESVFGAWDAELLDNGNFLVILFSTSKVQEITPTGKVVWQYDNLKNPYDADRLPNGNTLISDTFARRVIEVDRARRVVWEYSDNVHPYDADRLPNGNTLISDCQGDRVIEVTPTGKIVWQLKDVPNVHDADRLPNGNTLVTIRMLNEVREYDRDGRVVLRIRNLSSPSDADRLPDGRTVVAENGQVRIFDTRGEPTWKTDATWAVEVNPVWKDAREAQVKAGGR